jgi:hypothetical protein
MIGLVIIYLTGAVMAFRRTKKMYINQYKEDDWDRVFFGVAFGMASWFGYFIILTLDPIRPNSKPPKWL